MDGIQMDQTPNTGLEARALGETEKLTINLGVVDLGAGGISWCRRGSIRSAPI